MEKRLSLRTRPRRVKSILIDLLCGGGHTTNRVAASQKAQAKNMKTALLVGGGLIGFSFAQRFVGAGWQVRMTDVRAELADAVAQEFGDKVRFSTNLEDLTDSVDFVQEAGLESLEFKHKIFARLAGLTDAAILASSTSAILPSKSAADNPAAERIVIGHPFTPPALMPVLEVVPGPETAPETVERALEVYRELGFEPSAMKKEIPGFVGNRIQKVDMWEAISLVQQGVIDAKDLDTILRNSLGLRYAATGPFESNRLGGGPEGIKSTIEHIAGAWETEPVAGVPDMSHLDEVYAQVDVPTATTPRPSSPAPAAAMRCCAASSTCALHTSAYSARGVIRGAGCAGRPRHQGSPRAGRRGCHLPPGADRRP